MARLIVESFEQQTAFAVALGLDPATVVAHSRTPADPWHVEVDTIDERNRYRECVCIPDALLPEDVQPRPGAHLYCPANQRRIVSRVDR